jgi:hypothetical protein
LKTYTTSTERDESIIMSFMKSIAQSVKPKPQLPTHRFSPEDLKEIKKHFPSKTEVPKDKQGLNSKGDILGT